MTTPRSSLSQTSLTTSCLLPCLMKLHSSTSQTFLTTTYPLYIPCLMKLYSFPPQTSLTTTYLLTLPSSLMKLYSSPPPTSLTTTSLLDCPGVPSQKRPTPHLSDNHMWFWGGRTHCNCPCLQSYQTLPSEVACSTSIKHRRGLS